MARGYSQTLVDNQMKKAVAMPREDTLKLTTKERTNCIPLVTTFNNTKVIRDRWGILKLKPNLKDILEKPGMLAYHRPKNLKEMVGSNNILNNKVIRKTPTIKTIKFCKPCNFKDSLCCNHLKSTDSFTSFVTKDTYKIYHESNCKMQKCDISVRMYTVLKTICWKVRMAIQF